jgi:recombination protein RecR
MYPSSVQDLIDELGRLPGIGPKSAQRIAFHLLKAPPDEAMRLAGAIGTVKSKVSWCRRCFNFAEDPGATSAGQVECAICQDQRRDASVVCVVEEPRDVVAIERTGLFRGRYHVLQGTINHLEGVGADKLRIRELLARIEPEGITELVLCTNPTVEGAATDMYIGSLLKDLPVKVTRMATGLPVGGDLEYADEITLGRALEGRRALA